MYKDCKTAVRRMAGVFEVNIHREQAEESLEKKCKNQ